MKTKENINAVGNNSKSTAPNAVCWLDVILFEDNTIAVEIYYVDIVYEFKDEFNKHTFTTIKELDDFFKGEGCGLLNIIFRQLIQRAQNGKCFQIGIACGGLIRIASETDMFIFVIETGTVVDRAVFFCGDGYTLRHRPLLVYRKNIM